MYNTEAVDVYCFIPFQILVYVLYLHSNSIFVQQQVIL